MKTLEYLKHITLLGILLSISVLANAGDRGETIHLLPTAGGEAVHLLTSLGEKGQLPKGWEPLIFKKIERHTEYKVVQEEGKIVIQAESDRSASGIKHPFDLDPESFQTISWCWKVDHIISKGDVRKKSGDDYAARIYVTFKYDPDTASFWEQATFNTYKLFYGEYPPKGALNYVWANRLPKGESTDNPYTDRAQMVAVQSGKENLGKWVCEERNLFEDYKRLFGEVPTRISGVAVMTDTDNTGETATASYSDLILRATGK